ncbi:MAG TPA: M23 family metallopeptidase [Vicinamibacterales bacterium]
MGRLLRSRRARRKRAQRATLVIVGLAYCVGVTWLAVRIAWYSRSNPIRPVVDVRAEPDTPIATTGSDPPSPPTSRLPPSPRSGAFGRTVTDLRSRRLILPVRNVQPADLHQSFDEDRRGHLHEAIDILAARGTPVVAVEDGRIARLFFSRAGGHTIYHFDPTERFTYYYAHLEKYADGLAEGDEVRKGQVLAYVGTSGNAPESTPHLHFAIFELGPDKRWWQGAPIDPFLVWR